MKTKNQNTEEANRHWRNTSNYGISLVRPATHSRPRAPPPTPRATYPQPSSSSTWYPPNVSIPPGVQADELEGILRSLHLRQSPIHGGIQQQSSWNGVIIPQPYRIDNNIQQQSVRNSAIIPLQSLHSGDNIEQRSFRSGAINQQHLFRNGDNIQQQSFRNGVIVQKQSFHNGHIVLQHSPASGAKIQQQSSWNGAILQNQSFRSGDNLQQQSSQTGAIVHKQSFRNGHIVLQESPGSGDNLQQQSVRNGEIVGQQSFRNGTIIQHTTHSVNVTQHAALQLGGNVNQHMTLYGANGAQQKLVYVDANQQSIQQSTVHGFNENQEDPGATNQNRQQRAPRGRPRKPRQTTRRGRGPGRGRANKVTEEQLYLRGENINHGEMSFLGTNNNQPQSAIPSTSTTTNQQQVAPPAPHFEIPSVPLTVPIPPIRPSPRRAHLNPSPWPSYASPNWTNENVTHPAQGQRSDDFQNQPVDLSRPRRERRALDQNEEPYQQIPRSFANRAQLQQNYSLGHPVVPKRPRYSPLIQYPPLQYGQLPEPKAKTTIHYRPASNPQVVVIDLTGDTDEEEESGGREADRDVKRVELLPPNIVVTPPEGEILLTPEEFSSPENFIEELRVKFNFFN